MANEDSRISVHRGYSVDVAKQFPDGYFDFVYIDADHKYESVLDDLLAYEKKVKAGGIIIGNDYFDNLQPNTAFYGVIGAVNDFIKRLDWHFLALTSDEWSDYFLYKTKSPLVEEFMENMFNSDIDIVEINDYQAAGYCHKYFFTKQGKIKKIPSFRPDSME
jgi:hypothetical protein